MNRTFGRFCLTRIPFGRRRIGQANLVSQQFSRLASQFEIVVARLAVIRKERCAITCRRVVCAFKNRGAFIDFVEHGNVNHVAPNAFRGGDLRPEKLTLKPWNLVERFAGEIVPTESGKDDRQKVELLAIAPLAVGSPDGVSVTRRFGRVSISSDRPGADDIRMLDDLL